MAIGAHLFWRPSDFYNDSYFWRFPFKSCKEAVPTNQEFFERAKAVRVKVKSNSALGRYWAAIQPFTDAIASCRRDEQASALWWFPLSKLRTPSRADTV
jgi:hypothetical protein